MALMRPQWDIATEIPREALSIVSFSYPHHSLDAVHIGNKNIALETGAYLLASSSVSRAIDGPIFCGLSIKIICSSGRSYLPFSISNFKMAAQPARYTEACMAKSNAEVSGDKIEDSVLCMV